jgi:hypothetical protein
MAAMTITPKDGQKVQIFIDGEWVAATFLASSYFIPSEGEDEIWWMDHFSTDDGRHVPPAQSGDALPEWRPL